MKNKLLIDTWKSVIERTMEAQLLQQECRTQPIQPKGQWQDPITTLRHATYQSIRASAELDWINALICVYGKDVKFKFKNYDEKYGANECHIENGDIFKPSDIDVKTEYVICKAKELNQGDVIIHNYYTFTISSFEVGYGAGNEFGNYIKICGINNYGGRKDAFWSFENAPIIKVVESNGR